MTAEAAVPRPDPPPTRAMAAGIEHAILAEANRARAAQGLTHLEAREPLTEAARGHSAELARRRTLSHESERPELRTLADRLLAVEADDWSAVGENLAMISGPTAELPGRVVGGWLTSPGHRANLLEPRFTTTGVGVVLGREGVWYITQVYARPMKSSGR